MTEPHTISTRTETPGVRPENRPTERAPRWGENGASGAHLAGWPSGARILIYSHDTFGLGHFRRCLKIARCLNVTAPGCSVLLLTGSPLAHRYPLPEGVDFIKLPSVVKTGRNEYQARSARLNIDETIQLRAELIRSTAAAYRPDVFLVDHAPLGLGGEVTATLELLRAQSPSALTVLGLRDILDDPKLVTPQWIQEKIFEAMESFYDEIVVYGTPAIFEPTKAYEFPQAIRERTQYVGYVAAHEEDGSGSAPAVRGPVQPEVLLTVGGGEDGERIIGAYLEMLRDRDADVLFRSTILPGPLLSQAAVSRLRRKARGLGIRIQHFVDEVRPLMQRADLTISMGGYNAVSEILLYARRALIIPRDTPRIEQLMRAERMHAAGLVDIMRLHELGTRNLFETITGILNRPVSVLEKARRERALPLDGAQRMAAVLGNALVRHRTEEAS